MSTASANGENITQIFDQTDDVDWLANGEHLGVTTSTEVFTIHADGSEQTRVGSIPAGYEHEWLLPEAPCDGCPAFGW